MKRQSFIATVLLLTSVLLYASQASAADKPNVLFIAIDDMNDWATQFDDENTIQTLQAAPGQQNQTTWTRSSRD